MDRFGLIGISHRRASVEEIGWFAQRPSSLSALRDVLGVDEIFHVVTCNRVELYWVGGNGRESEKILRDYADWLFPGNEEKQRLAYSACYTLGGEAVHRHLYSVVCGLDSLVLGDDQVVGQVKRAIAESMGDGACGPWLGMFGDEALKLARRVRAQVDFQQCATSVSEVAALELRKGVRDLEVARVVMIGAGETIGILAPRLAGWQGTQLHFVNRTGSAARKLAEKYGGTWQPLAEFQAEPVDFDCMATATASPTPVFGPEHLAKLPTPERPRVILDLGVPADTDPILGESPHVLRSDVIEIGRCAEEGSREAELVIREVRPYLRDAVVHFRERVFRRQLNPIANKLRESVTDRAHTEAGKWLDGPLSHLSAEDKEHVRRFAARLADQTVQVPLVALRKTLRGLPMGDLLLERMRSEGRKAAGIEE